MDKKKIIAFYDQYVNRQAKFGLNDRIFFLFNKTKEEGLNSRSRILELGCGIGTLSFLLSFVVKKGFVEAVDISPESIEIARSKIKNLNIQFRVSDIVHYQPEQSSYDMITLFDVIEHIPLTEHDALFSKISGFMNEHTKLMINIPNPRYIEYDRMHHPERLQIVDEAVYLDKLSSLLDKNGLYIHYFQTHSIWVKDDYHCMLIHKKQIFEETKMSDIRTFSGKLKAKMRRTLNKLLYRF